MKLPNPNAEIEIGTHFFVIKPKSQQVYNLIYRFAFDLAEYEFKWDPAQRKNVRTLNRIWGGRLKNNTQFRYPIAMYDKFIQLLVRNGVQISLFNIEKIPVYEPAKANFVLNERYKPRDYQIEAADFADKQRLEGYPSVMLDMPTGSGKTVTLMNYAARLSLRTGIFVAPTHFDSWIKYFKQYLDLPSEKVYEVRGGKAIRKIFALAESDSYDYDVTLFSLRTLMDFFSAYEEDPQACIDLYGGTPFELWTVTKIGFLGGDEVHENFFNVYWMHTFIHGPFHLGLSATMLHKDKFIEARQLDVYPKFRRFDNIPLPKHVALVNMAYYFENMDRDKIQLTFPRRTTYSQAAFEKSILKNRKVKERFLRMIYLNTLEFFVSRKNPGEKCAWFFYRIDMLDEVIKSLKHHFPSLDIRRYAENDPLDNILEADITVTTVGSAGTGVDIDKLITLFNFVMMETAQKNIQLQGRLREKKTPEESEKIFIQFYSPNVKKHGEYKQYRDGLLSNRISGRIERTYRENL